MDVGGYGGHWKLWCPRQEAGALLGTGQVGAQQASEGLWAWGTWRCLRALGLGLLLQALPSPVVPGWRGPRDVRPGQVGGRWPAQWMWPSWWHWKCGVFTGQGWSAEGSVVLVSSAPPGGDSHSAACVLSGDHEVPGHMNSGCTLVCCRDPRRTGVPSWQDWAGWHCLPGGITHARLSWGPFLPGPDPACGPCRPHASAPAPRCQGPALPLPLPGRLGARQSQAFTRTLTDVQGRRRLLWLFFVVCFFFPLQ